MVWVILTSRMKTFSPVEKEPLPCWREFSKGEAGSKRMLELLKKDILVEQVENAARLANKHGINMLYFFMMGLPHEQKEDIVQSLLLMEQIRKIDPEAYIVGPSLY